VTFTAKQVPHAVGLLIYCQLPYSKSRLHRNPYIGFLQLPLIVTFCRLYSFGQNNGQFTKVDVRFRGSKIVFLQHVAQSQRLEEYTCDMVPFVTRRRRGDSPASNTYHETQQLTGCCWAELVKRLRFRLHDVTRVSCHMILWPAVLAACNSGARN
jgi:hypothetical protein